MLQKEGQEEQECKEGPGAIGQEELFLLLNTKNGQK